MFSTKMLPPSNRKPSWWFNFKYDAGKWLKARCFPPSMRESYNWDTMFEDAEADDKLQRQKYPVRWCIEKTWDFVSKWPKISNAWYWFRTHTYNRYHILDLRKAEPENPDGYRWGYLDQCSKIELAMFLVLRDYWENGNPMGGPLTDPLTWNPDLTEDERTQILAESTEGDRSWIGGLKADLKKKPLRINCTKRLRWIRTMRLRAIHGLPPKTLRINAR